MKRAASGLSSPQKQSNTKSATTRPVEGVPKLTSSKSTLKIEKDTHKVVTETKQSSLIEF